MTIVYLCGENSIWKISNVELLESALTEEDLDLVRIIQEDANIRGKFRVEYELMDRERFIELQRDGMDVLMYFKEDIRAQLRRISQKSE